jgi:hypothetical protein
MQFRHEERLSQSTVWGSDLPLPTNADTWSDRPRDLAALTSVCATPGQKQ